MRSADGTLGQLRKATGAPVAAGYEQAEPQVPRALGHGVVAPFLAHAFLGFAVIVELQTLTST